MKIYEYSKCSTCKKALKFLDDNEVSYQKIPIVETPPSLSDLKKMLKFIKAKGGGIKNLFNTSGVQYRELKISEKLKNGLTEEKALDLLSKNGKLIKRPFILSNSDGVLGFKEDQMRDLLGI